MGAPSVPFQTNEFIYKEYLGNQIEKVWFSFLLTCLDLWGYDAKARLRCTIVSALGRTLEVVSFFQIRCRCFALDSKFLVDFRQFLLDYRFRNCDLLG